LRKIKNEAAKSLASLGYTKAEADNIVNAAEEAVFSQPVMDIVENLLKAESSPVGFVDGSPTAAIENSVLVKLTRQK
jgi:hypothetical protein